MFSKRTIFLAIIGVIIITIIYSLCVDYSYPNVSDRGVFGDKFGGLTSLFSGLALAGVIYTLLMQQAQLKIQQDELRLQREEMRMMREETIKRREVEEQQSFFGVFNSINSSMRIVEGQVEMIKKNIEQQFTITDH